jgi:fumarate reductase flavoprotein subunit
VAGVEDSPDIFFADIMAKTRGQTDPVLARAIADRAGECVDWLIDRHDMPYGLDIRFRAAYGHTRPRVHGWLGHGGGDLLQLLHARVEAAGADVLTGARLTRVFAGPDGLARGVEIERPDGARERIGCGALVMAMGGFAGNPALVRRHMPEAADAGYNGHEGSHGDAVTFGLALGAAVADMGSYQGYRKASACRRGW